MSRGRAGGRIAPHKHLHLMGDAVDWICYHCGEKVRCVTCIPHSPTGPPVRRATRDHLIPWSQGGRSGNGNLVLSCFSCNQRRKPEATVKSEAGT
jgi:5-methylcytosine-specific restriction endonuclease McrA